MSLLFTPMVHLGGARKDVDGLLHEPRRAGPGPALRVNYLIVPAPVDPVDLEVHLGEVRPAPRIRPLDLFFAPVLH